VNQSICLLLIAGVAHGYPARHSGNFLRKPDIDCRSYKITGGLGEHYLSLAQAWRGQADDINQDE
jgi:hypothetical protein